MAALMQNEKEAAQRAKQAVALRASTDQGQLQDPAKRKLSVGASVASAHIDYDYFEVGAGQVSVLFF